MAQRKKPASGKALSLALSQLSSLPGAARSPHPGFIEPALATLKNRPPSGDKWIHELKLDGYRAQAHLLGGEARIYTRRGNDWSKRFKPVAEEISMLPAQSLILDGEIVAMDETDRVNFGLLQADLGKERTDHLAYYAFDILYLNGYDLRKVPQIERKRLLSSLLKMTMRSRVLYSEHFEIEGDLIFKQICDLGMEGIVSKFRDAPYTSGRSDHWLKTKCSKAERLPVIGFKADRSGVAALYVGRWSGTELAYAGKVGTGFSMKNSQLIREVLDTVRTDKCPVQRLRKPKVIWVRPEFEAQVQYTEVTSDGLMRHASFKGLEPVTTPLPPIKPAKPPAENIMRILPDAVAPGSDELKAYWKAVSRRAMKYLGGRPLTLVRNIGGTVFFHKGPFPPLPSGVHSFQIEKREGGAGTRLWIDSLEGLYGLVDLGAIELHPWQSRVEDFERADLIVFDLDPGKGIETRFVTDTALLLRDFLEQQGFDSWPKTSGGKGYHLMVPLDKAIAHDAARELSKKLAIEFSRKDPRYITTSDPKARAGHVFIDYLRNGRGTTTVGAFSPRARAGLPVSMPVTWKDIEAGVLPDAFKLRDFLH